MPQHKGLTTSESRKSFRNRAKLRTALQKAIRSLLWNFPAAISEAYAKVSRKKISVAHLAIRYIDLLQGTKTKSGFDFHRDVGLKRFQKKRLTREILNDMVKEPFSKQDLKLLKQKHCIGFNAVIFRRTERYIIRLEREIRLAKGAAIARALAGHTNISADILDDSGLDDTSDAQSDWSGAGVWEYVDCVEGQSLNDEGAVNGDATREESPMEGAEQSIEGKAKASSSATEQIEYVNRINEVNVSGNFEVKTEAVGEAMSSRLENKSPAADEESLGAIVADIECKRVGGNAASKYQQSTAIYGDISLAEEAVPEASTSFHATAKYEPVPVVPEIPDFQALPQQDNVNMANNQNVNAEEPKHDFTLALENAVEAMISDVKSQVSIQEEPEESRDNTVGGGGDGGHNSVVCISSGDSIGSISNVGYTSTIIDVESVIQVVGAAEVERRRALAEEEEHTGTPGVGGSSEPTISKPDVDDAALARITTNNGEAKAESKAKSGLSNIPRYFNSWLGAAVGKTEGNKAEGAKVESEKAKGVNVNEAQEEGDTMTIE